MKDLKKIYDVQFQYENYLEQFLLFPDLQQNSRKLFEKSYLKDSLKDKVIK